MTVLIASAMTATFLTGLAFGFIIGHKRGLKEGMQDALGKVIGAALKSGDYGIGKISSTSVPWPFKELPEEQGDIHSVDLTKSD